jgi:hypothetical protein
VRVLPILATVHSTFGDGCGRVSTIAQKASVGPFTWANSDMKVMQAIVFVCAMSSNFALNTRSPSRGRFEALLGPFGCLFSCSGPSDHRFPRCSSTSFERLPGRIVLWHLGLPVISDSCLANVSRLGSFHLAGWALSAIAIGAA